MFLCCAETNSACRVAGVASQSISLLGIGLELGAHLALLELLGEPLVIAPKQANVWNVEKYHG